MEIPIDHFHNRRLRRELKMEQLIAQCVKLVLPALLLAGAMYVASMLLINGAGPTVWLGLAVVVFLIALGDRITENLR